MTYRITRISPPYYAQGGMSVVLVVTQHPLRLTGARRDDWDDARDRHVRRVADSCGCPETHVMVETVIADY